MVQFSYTALMSKNLQAHRVNMQVFAQEGEPYDGITLLQNLERVQQETLGLKSDSAVHWQATSELRPAPSGDDQIWLHLTASTAVPLACQRCMAAVEVGLTVDQWYRFVATEDIAMAEDDQSEEDLLVMAPSFDLLALLEDELLMAIPLVPMHEACPVIPTLSAGSEALAPADDAGNNKPNPFAVLAGLRQTK
jgi:uncharacterized protein